eukprot:1212432-Amphidinium_carterae.1
MDAIPGSGQKHWCSSTCLSARLWPGHQGPLLLDDWTPIAEKYLEGKSIILNTDAAKAYNREVEGVLHTSVRHTWKKIGKVWHKPKYAELDSVVAEDGSVIKIYKGTQTIDGVWKHLRDGVCQSGGSKPQQIETL